MYQRGGDDIVFYFLLLKLHLGIDNLLSNPLGEFVKLIIQRCNPVSFKVQGVREAAGVRGLLSKMILDSNQKGRSATYIEY